MAVLIDTSVAIWMRDSGRLRDLLAGLDPPVHLSAISRVELENGVYREPSAAAARRAALDLILENVPTLPFGVDEIDAYRAIIAAIGYSRRKVIDRMIAAQALARALTLVTLNGTDFRDIPDLKLEAWDQPGG